MTHGAREIALETDLASDLPYLEGDRVQLQQVLVNLVRNALDSLAATEPQDPTVFCEPRSGFSGDCVPRHRQRGRDSPGRLGQIFDAYFSTRDEGMGMGLAISRTIVDAHQGRIDVESLPGIRTCFRFTLPSAGTDDAGYRRSTLLMTTRTCGTPSAG